MLAFQLEFELWHIRRIWNPWFYTYVSNAQRTVTLKWPIFKPKKGFANLSLGLIHYSIASSQPPSCNTVPLRAKLHPNLCLLHTHCIIRFFYATFTCTVHVKKEFFDTDGPWPTVDWGQGPAHIEDVLVPVHSTLIVVKIFSWCVQSRIRLRRIATLLSGQSKGISLSVLQMSRGKYFIKSSAINILQFLLVV
jgi:hypothetical protein